jgi:kynureninase
MNANRANRGQTTVSGRIVDPSAACTENRGLSLIENAVAALGPGPLTADGVARHIAPLFSRVLERNSGEIYLANHSLGRPLDATASDLAEAGGLWQTRMGDAWDSWSGEMQAYRTRLVRLLARRAPTGVVPKTSAGQGLRAILNTSMTPCHAWWRRVASPTRSTSSCATARRGRIAPRFVEPRVGLFAVEDLFAAVRNDIDLVVLSQVSVQHRTGRSRTTG